MSPKDLAVSAPASPSGEDMDPKITASLQVSAVILRDSGFSIRTNNLYAYLEANRHVRIHPSTCHILIRIQY
jgi:hypothetical protein